MSEIRLADLGLTPSLGQTKVAQRYAPSEAQAAFPLGYARAQAEGLNPMELSVFDIAWLEAAMRGQAGEYGMTGPLVTDSNIIMPQGAYWFTISPRYGRGIVKGGKSSHTDLNGGTSNHSTTLWAWHEEWNGDPGVRHGVMPGIYGRNDIYSYLEGFRLQDFRVYMRQHNFPDQDFVGSGVVYWRTGEASSTDQVYVYSARGPGFLVNACVPHHFGNISAFDCTGAGLGLRSCALSSIRVDVLSVDDNSCAFDTLAGPLDQGGGSISIGTIKSEGGISPGRAYRGQIVGHLTGQFNVHIGAIQAATEGGMTVDSLFVVDPRLTSGAGQGSMLTVGGMKGWRYNHILQDLRTGTAWGSFGDYQAGQFRWHASEGMQAWPSRSQSSIGTVRRGFGTGGGPVPSTPYREVLDGPPRRGTTIYIGDLVEPPPPTCSWTLGPVTPWADVPCVDGVKTRVTSYVSTVPGCTPSDPQPPARVESQDCGTVDPPPPTGGAIWATEFTTQGSAIIATVGQNIQPVHLPSSIVGGVLRMRETGDPWSEGYACDIRGAKRIVLHGYGETGPAYHRYLLRCNLAGQSIDASIRKNDNGWFMDMDTDLAIPSLMEGGNLILELPQAVDIRRLFGDNPLRIQMDGMTIYGS